MCCSFWHVSWRCVFSRRSSSVIICNAHKVFRGSYFRVLFRCLLRCMHCQSGVSLHVIFFWLVETTLSVFLWRCLCFLNVWACDFYTSSGALVTYFCCDVSDVGCYFSNFRTSGRASLQALWDSLTISRSIAVGDSISIQKVEKKRKTVNDWKFYHCYNWIGRCRDANNCEGFKRKDEKTSFFEDIMSRKRLLTLSMWMSASRD